MGKMRVVTDCQGFLQPATMGSTWFKNFAGIKQTDFEMLKVPNPGAEFCIHVTLRSIQTGALLGSVLGPLSALAFQDGRVQGKSVRDAFVEGGRNGALIGAAIGPVLTYMAMRDMSSAKVYDKCYRLRFNSEQLWLDRSCVMSAAFGFLSNGTAGMVVGMDLALLFHSIGGMVWGK